MPCHGNSDDHCCVFGGVDCPYIEKDTVAGRKWACGLLRELGDWDQVLADPRYIQDVQPKYEQHGIDHNCKTWPSEGCDCAD